MNRTTDGATIDINADLGEGAPNDRAILRHVTSANISCGYHAGDAATMREAIDAARVAGVAVGAHPGFDDREHFGRREIALATDEVYALITQQVREFITAAHTMGVRVAHVKPHGALYNMAARDRALADAIARAVRDIDASLMLVGLARSELVAAGRAHRLHTLAEGFPDRGQAPDGMLLPRGSEGALVSDPDVAAARAVEMARRGDIDTLCIHGDAPHAPDIARGVREALERAGFTVIARHAA